MVATKRTGKRDLLLLFSVPLLLAGILAAVVYIPQLLARPSHDFVYAVCDSYTCSDRVAVVDGTVTIEEKTGTKSYSNDRLLLRYYDVSEGSSRAVTLQEAQRYRLDNSSRSPDGYTLTRESSSGFLFWSDGASQWVLKDGLRKKQVDVSYGSRYYAHDVTFIGWVE